MRTIFTRIITARARPDGHEHHGEIGHESPPVMTLPLLVLAGCTILIGLVCLVAGIFFAGPSEWFAAPPGEDIGVRVARRTPSTPSRWMTAIVGTFVGAGGDRPELCHVRLAQPVPGPAGRSVPGLVSGFAAQVLHRRDLPVGGRPAALRRWLSSANSWMTTWWIGLVSGWPTAPGGSAGRVLAPFRTA